MSRTRADDEAGEAYDSAGDAGDSGGLVGADAVSAAIAADESETKIKNLCGNIPAGKKYFLVPALYILEAYRIKEVSQLQRTFFLFPRRAGRAYSGPPPPPPWNLSGIASRAPTAASQEEEPGAKMLIREICKDKSRLFSFGSVKENVEKTHLRVAGRGRPLRGIETGKKKVRWKSRPSKEGLAGDQRRFQGEGPEPEAEGSSIIRTKKTR